MTNQDLAAAAIDIANQAPGGSMDRRAAGCAAVCLATTKTPAGARKALKAAQLDEAVRDAAALLVDALDAQPATVSPTDANQEGAPA